MASSFPAGVAYNFDKTLVEQYTPSQVSGEELEVGDFVVWDDANNWVERAGTNPTAIVGISEVDSEDARVLTPDGQVPVRTLSAEAVIRLASATTLTVADHLNQEYGITRVNGYWLLDTAKTGANARVLVTRIDTDTNSAYCKVLAEYLVDGIDS